MVVVDQWESKPFPKQKRGHTDTEKISARAEDEELDGSPGNPRRSMARGNSSRHGTEEWWYDILSIQSAESDSERERGRVDQNQKDKRLNA